MYNQYYSSYHHYLGRYLHLNQGNIDDFYDLYVNQQIHHFTLKESQDKIKIDISKEDHIYSIHVEMDDELLMGQCHLYKCVESQGLERITLDHQGHCLHFLNSFEDSYMYVDENDFMDFYKYILSSYKDYFDIEDLNIENEYSFIKIYGDIDENSQIYFKVIYEDENQNRVHAFDDCLMTAYQQDIVENYLSACCQRIDHENGIVYFDAQLETTYQFMHEGIEFLKEYCEVYVSETLKKFGQAVHYPMTIGVRIENDLLYLDIESVDIPKMEISQVLDMYKQKKKYYRLKSGELLSLDSPQLEELSDLMDQYHITTKDIDDGHIALNKNRVFSLDEDMNQYQYIDIDRQQSFQKYLDDFVEYKQVAIPQAYTSILRDYQKEGFQWLRTLYDYGFHGVLADDMGLGKTLQVIALLESLDTTKSSLVVCPASLIYNWEDEIHKFSKVLKPKCIVGSLEERRNLIHQEDQCIYLTSYDYIRRDYKEYNDIEFEYIILDESQYIKNQNTKNAKAVKQLKGLHRLALSGTPIENSLAELWSVFDFLMPQYLFQYHYFQKMYETKIVKNQDQDAIKQLQKLVSPFILRRQKKDVLLELPDKIEKTQLISFDVKESELYYANMAKINKELQSLFQMEKVDKIKILSMLTRLRQICCEPRMIYENIENASSKMKACMDLICNYKAQKQKVLVFSSFTKVFELLVDEFNMHGIKYLVLTGKTSKELRKEYVKKFQEEDIDVFLISLKAGGTGLNLTAAQAVIHFDPWWNISAQNQATDRAHRIGQNHTVMVHKLIMKDSIEERILTLQEKKKELADMFIDSSEGQIAQLSKEDLMELFAI